MRRYWLWLTILAGVAAGGAPPLAAQDDGAAIQPGAPVYSLPPGRRVDPDPARQVQGPRVPGEIAPRVIRPESGARQDQAQPAISPPRLPQVTESRQPTRTAEAQPRAAPPTGGTGTSAPASERTAQVQRQPDTIEPPAGAVRETPDSAVPAPPPADLAPAEPDTGSPFPTWLLLFGVLLLGGGAAWLWRRRAAAEADGPAVELAEPVLPAPRPASRPVPAVVPPASTPAVAPGPPAALSAPVRLQIDFRPYSARLTPMGFTVRYRLRLANIGIQPADGVAIDMGIRAADSASAQNGVAELEPRFEIEELPAGAERVHEGEIRLSPQAFTAYRVDQRMLLFPIVDLAVRHGARDKKVVTSASFLIGQEQTPPSAKMAPFRLDRGIGEFNAVGGRRIELSAAA